jgi:DNA polymerase-3 subunit delta
VPSARSTAAPVALIWGEDDFAVDRRARQLFEEWTRAVPGADREILDARADNSTEALRALARLREALQTLPFFGSEKLVWFRNCTFLGDDRTAASAAVTEELSALAQELKRFDWRGVRLLISAPLGVDRRRVFYKTLESLGQVEEHPGLSPEDSHWAEQAEAFVRRELAARGKQITEAALGRLLSAVGPHLRLLASETEKLSLYVGERSEITAEDVDAIVSGWKQARAFALAEALGDRNLPEALQALDKELWEIRLKVDKDKSSIGLLYGLIAKVRLLLLLKELVRLGHLKPGASPNQVRTSLERLPAELLPADRRYNPAAQHPYVVSKALAQVSNYSTRELVRAMDTLLECNQRLVGSGLDDALVLQQALVQIIGAARPVARRAVVAR